MDYNTQREKLILPEYGRNVQKMIEQVKSIEDKEKRSQQMRAVVQVMGILNPQIRELNDYRHKLWDHAQVIGGFDMDIDAPYPAPTPQQFSERPDAIELPLCCQVQLNKFYCHECACKCGTAQSQ